MLPPVSFRPLPLNLPIFYTSKISPQLKFLASISPFPFPFPFSSAKQVQPYLNPSLPSARQVPKLISNRFLSKATPSIQQWQPSHSIFVLLQIQYSIRLALVRGEVREQRQCRQKIWFTVQHRVKMVLDWVQSGVSKLWQNEHYIYYYLPQYLYEFSPILKSTVVDRYKLAQEKIKIYLLRISININNKTHTKREMSQQKPQQKEGPRYKIIIVGDVNVGKTALFWRYIEGQFLANKSTLVTTVDFKMKTITIGDKNVKLYLWDTAGSEQYRSIVTTYFKGCHGVAVVFDLSRESSFKNAVEYWVPLAKSKTPNAVYILIGNKSDLDVRVSREEVQKWSKENNVHYIETSVKLNKNVVQAFDWLGHRIHEHENSFTKAQSFALNTKENRLSANKDKKCCGS